MKALVELLYPNSCLSCIRPVFFLLISFSFLTLSADDQLAALEKTIQSLPIDTVKANKLLYLGEKYCSIDNDKALMYLQEAFTISSQQKYERGIGKSLLWQGRVYYYKDDYPLSIRYLDMAIPYLENAGNKHDLSFLHFAKGESYRIRGDYIRAIESYNSALNLAENMNDLKLKSTYLSSMGRVHLSRKETKKAMGYFIESLRLKEAINDRAGISNILTCIGMAYEKLDQPDSALWYYDRALTIRAELNIERAVASSLYNRAGILIKQQKYEEAEKSLLEALDIFTRLEEKTGILITNLRMAVAMNRQNKPVAIDMAHSALEMARIIDNPSLISLAYETLSDIFYYDENYKIAHQYLVKHKAIDDSILNIEKERILTEFEEKFQSERKDREIENYRAKNKLQYQNILLLAMLLLAASGFAVLLFFLFRMKSTALKRQKKLHDQEQVIHLQETALSEKENQLLQEQLEAKNRALASKALEMLRLNETISQIVERLELFNSNLNENPDVSKHINEIINDLENQTKQNIWSEFNKIFKNIHSDFYDKLLKVCPDLTATEIKTAALLKLNLTTKEIASISFKSEGGVKTIRYRLRKKLGLSGDEKLIPFLMQI